MLTTRTGSTADGDDVCRRVRPPVMNGATASEQGLKWQQRQPNDEFHDRMDALQQQQRRDGFSPQAAKKHDVKSGPLEQQSQPGWRETGEILWIGVIVEMEGHGHDQRATWLEYSGDLNENVFGTTDVLEHFGADCAIERRIPDRQIGVEVRADVSVRCVRIDANRPVAKLSLIFAGPDVGDDPAKSSALFDDPGIKRRPAGGTQRATSPLKSPTSRDRSLVMHQRTASSLRYTGMRRFFAMPS